MITQEDVAKRAGVSFITVSRVINNKPYVNDKTKQRVLKAIKELNYYPNSLGRALNMNKSNIIGIEIPLMLGITIHETPYYSELLTGIELACEDSDYDILISASKKAGPNTGHLQNYFERKVDGVIIFTPNLAELPVKEIENQNIPCVLVGERPDNHISYIDSDNKAGTIKIIEYLIKMGHKKIGFLKGFVFTRNGADRLEGYIDAMKQNNLPFHPEFIYDGDFGYECGRETARKILKSKERPTALFCSNDQMAIGFLMEAQVIGLKVPEDISVVGFDDILISSFTTPTLTTMKQPLVEMGKAAATMLINKINSPHTTSEIRIFPVELMARNSVKRI